MKPRAGAWHCHRQRDKGAPSLPSAGTDSTESFEVWLLGSWPPVVGLKVYSAFANRLDTPRESRRSPPPSRLLFRVAKDTPWLLHIPPAAECSAPPRTPKAHLHSGPPEKMETDMGTAQGLPSPGQQSSPARLTRRSARHTLPGSSLRASLDSAFWF